MSSLIVAILMTLSAAAPRAAVEYVNQQASGPVHDGSSWPSAFTTVQAGLTGAHPGDEVWVTAGTYVENVSFTAGASLYGGFKGAETVRDQRDWKANPTVLDGDAKGSVVTIPKGADNAVVDGFTIRNGSAVEGSGIHVDANGVRIAHNIIEKCQASNMFTYGGGVYCSGAALTVANNTIRDNHLDAADSAFGGGVCFFGGSGRVTNNLFYRNSVVGTDGSDGSAVAAILGASVDVVNNTVTNCHGSALRPYSFCFGLAISVGWDSRSSIVNNVVAFNTNGIGAQWDSIRNNLVYQNDRCDNTQAGMYGNIGGDPLFVDAAAENYRLLPGSPGLDSGDTTAVLPGERDLDNRPRVWGGWVDRGAYEALSGVTMQDVILALRAAGGLITLSQEARVRLNVAGGPSADRVDMVDAVVLARVFR